jgi:hypothetical protein
VAFTTWNPSDKSANCVLSNGNLTAGASTNAINGARSVDYHLAGKYYWEDTWVTTGASDCIGIATAAGSLTTGPTSPGPRCLLNQNATIYLNGTSTGVGLGGSITSGSVICIAVDLDNSRIWFRNGAAGNWNNSGTANPATGTGGVSITSQFAAQNTYATAIINLTNGHVTANFGSSAFAGVAPAGFTAGFPAGPDVVGGVAQALAMVMA